MEQVEDRMYNAAVESGMVTPNVEKRSESVVETAEVATSE
jgi:hypothetical protein